MGSLGCMNFAMQVPTALMPAALFFHWAMIVQFEMMLRGLWGHDGESQYVWDEFLRWYFLSYVIFFKSPGSSLNAQKCQSADFLN